MSQRQDIIILYREKMEKINRRTFRTGIKEVFGVSPIEKPTKVGKYYIANIHHKGRYATIQYYPELQLIGIYLGDIDPHKFFGYIHLENVERQEVRKNLQTIIWSSKIGGIELGIHYDLLGFTMRSLLYIPDKYREPCPINKDDMGHRLIDNGPEVYCIECGQEFYAIGIDPDKLKHLEELFEK